jgi:hypothetical protein
MKNIFVYVMTHPGDPDERGCWGCEDCMGMKRWYEYDAVIGVGGLGASAHGFAGQLKWIGIGPHKTDVGERGPEVTFDHFWYDSGTEMLEVHEMAPKLAEHIRRAPRGFMNLTRDEHAEGEKLLELAKKAPPSSARGKHSAGYDQVNGKDLSSRSPKDHQRPRKRCSRRLPQ